VKNLLKFVSLAAILGVVALGCSQNDNPQIPSTTPGILGSAVLYTETLGPIGIPLNAGTGIVVGGVGTREVQPGTITVNVPGAVAQVILFWEGNNPTAVGDGQITVEGNTVNGTQVGGFTYFYTNAWTSTWRADITSLGVVASGANSIEVSGMNFTKNNGVGMVVIYDDGSDPADIGVREGNDCAYHLFTPPLNTTVPQTFPFAAATMGRHGSLAILASSVGLDRPNVIRVTSGGVVTDYVDQLFDANGEKFDALMLEVDIPAGATDLTVQILSDKGEGSTFSGDNASVIWSCAALSVVPEALEGCTPGYWKNTRMHYCEWDASGYGTDDDFDTVFGTNYFNPDRTLLEALNSGGGGYDALGRHAVAALLSAANPGVNYGLTVNEVKAAVLAGNKNLLAHYNEMGCPLNNCKDEPQF
jgi:hypothetical protein